MRAPMQRLELSGGPVDLVKMALQLGWELGYS